MTGKAKCGWRVASLSWLGVLLWSPHTVAQQLASQPLTAYSTPDREPNAQLGLAVGAGVAMSSLAAGSLMLTANDNLRLKHAGLAVLDTGMVVAPLLSHALVGEWARGAYFSLVPLAGGIGMLTLLSISPVSPVKSKHGNHKIYPIPLSISILGGGLGVLDTALLGGRMPNSNTATDLALHNSLPKTTWSAAVGPTSTTFYLAGVF